MGWIVDRIVSVDAPVATLAERVSINMLDARRAERNYFLLHDPKDLEANRQSMTQVSQLVETIGNLQSEEKPATDKMLEEAKKRDHRKIGAEMGLYALDTEYVGPGMPLWLPKGGAIVYGPHYGLSPQGKPFDGEPKLDPSLKTVDAGSYWEATRKRLLFRAPQSPLSAPTRMTARAR